MKFTFFKKKTYPGATVDLAITGMHCSSCPINIDGALEDLPGVYESTTNYAKARTHVAYDPQKVAVDQMKAEIVKLGYEVDMYRERT